MIYYMYVCFILNGRTVDYLRVAKNYGTRRRKQQFCFEKWF